MRDAGPVDLPSGRKRYITGTGAAEDGTFVAVRPIFNFIGASVTDDPGNNRVDIEFLGSGGGGAVTVQKDGVTVATETILNMHDTGNCTVTVTDEGGKVGITVDVPFSLAAPGGVALLQMRTDGDGGSGAVGDWRQRWLTDTGYDEINVVVIRDTLAIGGIIPGRTFRLPAGDYDVLILPIQSAGDEVQSRIYDETGAAALLLGHSSFVRAHHGIGGTWLMGQFSLATDSIVSIQTQQADAVASSWGLDFNFDEHNINLLGLFRRIEDGVPWRDVMHVRQVQDSGNNCADATVSGNWDTVSLNAVELNEIAGASLASNIITLAAGTYMIETQVCCGRTTNIQSRVRDLDLGVTVMRGTNSRSNTGSLQLNSQPTYCLGYITLGVETDIQLQVRTTNTTTAANGSMGWPCSFGDDEIYAEVWIERVR